MEKQTHELENDRVLELIVEDRRLSLLVLVAGQPRVGFRLNPRQASDLMQVIGQYLLELT